MPFLLSKFKQCLKGGSPQSHHEGNGSPGEQQEPAEPRVRQSAAKATKARGSGSGNGLGRCAQSRRIAQWSRQSGAQQGKWPRRCPSRPKWKCCWARHKTQAHRNWDTFYPQDNPNSYPSGWKHGPEQLLQWFAMVEITHPVNFPAAGSIFNRMFWLGAIWVGNEGRNEWTLKPIGGFILTPLPAIGQWPFWTKEFAPAHFPIQLDINNFYRRYKKWERKKKKRGLRRFFSKIWIL